MLGPAVLNEATGRLCYDFQTVAELAVKLDDACGVGGRYEVEGAGSECSNQPSFSSQLVKFGG